MRPKTPITKEQALAALAAANHDVEAAGERLGVSGRTLRRRMAEYGIKRPDRYEAAEAA